MKKISVVIPAYNEIENVEPISKNVISVFEESLPTYDYEIIFIDNCSKDGTRNKLLKMAEQNKKIKLIFNTKNFGQIRSPFHGMCQSTGDATVIMCCDFQEPPECIIEFVKAWESDYKIAIGIKTKSKEGRIMYLVRSVYYGLLKRISDVEQIQHFTGFGLYDKSFIDVLKQLDDPMPYLRGIVAELGPSRKEIPFEQPNRKFGKSHNNFYSLYDYAMVGITSYSKFLLRITTFIGFIVAMMSFIVGVVFFILKLSNWDKYPMGIVPIIICICFLGAMQLFFIGILGEYVLNVNMRIMKRPLVIEEKRINFDD